MTFPCRHNGRQPFLKHKVGNITIKTCSEYIYLGTTFTPSNSFKVGRKQLQKKASKAMFTFLRHNNTYEGAKPKTINCCLTLFGLGGGGGGQNGHLEGFCQISQKRFS